LKTYEEYKDSGIEWVGSIPVLWEKYTAKYIFKKLSRPIRDEDDIVTAFRDGEVTLRRNRRLEGFTNSIKEIGYQGVRNNDLVIHAMDGFAGAIGVSDSDGKCSPVYSICIPQKLADTRYYAYLLRYMALTGYIQSLAKGTRERSTEFRYSAFKVLDLPFPSFAEQTQIASYLDHKTSLIDKLLEKNEKLIGLLEEQRSAIINQAVTKGLDPDVKMKDSGIEWIGEIPEHWDRIRIKNLVKVKVCDGPHETPEFLEDGVPFISAEAIQNACINFDRKRGYISFDQFAEYSNKSRVKQGDILFCKSGSTTGKSALVTTSEAFGIWSPLAIIRANKYLVKNTYLYMYMQSRLFRIQVENNWTFGTQPNIGMGSLENLWITVPPSTEQTQIANYLDSKTTQIDKLIDQKRKSNDYLKEYRTTLISNVVTGKVDVRDEKIPESFTQ